MVDWLIGTRAPDAGETGRSCRVPMTMFKPPTSRPKVLKYINDVNKGADSPAPRAFADAVKVGRWVGWTTV